MNPREYSRQLVVGILFGRTRVGSGKLDYSFNQNFRHPNYYWCHVLELIRWIIITNIPSPLKELLTQKRTAKQTLNCAIHSSHSSYMACLRVNETHPPTKAKNNKKLRPNTVDHANESPIRYRLSLADGEVRLFHELMSTFVVHFRPILLVGGCVFFVRIPYDYNYYAQFHSYFPSWRLSLVRDCSLRNWCSVMQWRKKWRNMYGDWFYRMFSLLSFQKRLSANSQQREGLLHKNQSSKSLS